MAAQVLTGGTWNDCLASNCSSSSGLGRATCANPLGSSTDVLSVVGGDAGPGQAACPTLTLLGGTCRGSIRGRSGPCRATWCQGSPSMACSRGAGQTEQQRKCGTRQPTLAPLMLVCPCTRNLVMTVFCAYAPCSHFGYKTEDTYRHLRSGSQQHTTRPVQGLTKCVAVLPCCKGAVASTAVDTASTAVAG